jgi:hypothetical protein
MADDKPQSWFSEYKIYIHWIMISLITISSSLVTRYLGPDVKLPPLPPTLTTQELREAVREEMKGFNIESPKNVGKKP